MTGEALILKVLAATLIALSAMAAAAAGQTVTLQQGAGKYDGCKTAAIG